MADNSLAMKGGQPTRHRHADLKEVAGRGAELVIGRSRHHSIVIGSVEKRGRMAALTAAIRVNYRFIDGYQVYTSDDVYGLYVANRDPARAYAAVAPSLERLIQLNEGIALRVEPVLTFSELVRSARHPEQAILHEITSRSFVAHAA